MGFFSRLFHREERHQSGDKTGPSLRERAAAMSIKATPQHYADDAAYQAEVIEAIEAEVRASPLFLPGRVGDVIAAMKSTYRPMSRISPQALRRGKTVRGKDGSILRLVDCMAGTEPSHNEGIRFLDEVCVRQYNNLYPKFALAKMKRLGIKLVEISTCSYSCAASRAIAGVYPINKVPALPLPDCALKDAGRCWCMYIPAFRSENPKLRA